MELKRTNGKSAKEQMIDLLTETLPTVRETGIINHLRKIHAPKWGKGKVVNFCWKQREFRVTANLKVMEYGFGFNARWNLINNEISAELETCIRNAQKGFHLPACLKDVRPVVALPVV